MPTIYVLLNDKKQVAGAKTFFQEDEAVFREWNEKGWGVYFSVNEFSEARKEEFCTKLRYVYADLDIAKAGDGQTRQERQNKKTKLLNALLGKCEPTIIIDTSNGLQPLWEITDNEPTLENKAKYTKIIKGIVEWSKEQGSKADNVYDCSRILRLAGYYHQKEEPYLCLIISKSDKKYSFQELENIFPFEEKKLEYQPVVISDNSNPVFNAINKIDFKELVIKSFASVGRPVSFDESGHLIDPVGGTTGTFLGRKGDRDYLASSSHEPYKGNRITAVAEILKVDYGDAYKWICKEYQLDFKKLINEEKTKNFLKEMEFTPKEKKDTRYTWGTNYLDDNFAIIKPTNFIVIAAKRGAGKTTYAFDMAVKNAKEKKHKVLFISLEMETDDILDDFSRKYSGITIPEEYNFQIPDYKKAAYDRKKDSIKDISNLILEGIRRSGDVTWEIIMEIIKKHKEIDMVFIDNLDLIAGREGENDWQKQKRLVTQIMAFASTNQIPIILIHHYRKSMGGKDYGMDELSGSGKISDGADRVIKVVRNSDPQAIYPEKFKSTIYLQKGRGYPEWKADIYFIRGTFMDIAPTEYDYYNQFSIQNPTQEEMNKLEEVCKAFDGRLLEDNQQVLLI